MPEDWTTGLAIVAHPDDLEYGAASAVAKWTAAGKRIAYVLVTSGEAGLAIPPEEAGPLREAEERASAAVVGVDTVEFLGHRDGVITEGLELRRDLARAIRRHRPEVVIGINFRDSWGGPSLNMADHRHVGIATIDATRDARTVGSSRARRRGTRAVERRPVHVLQCVTATVPLRRHHRMVGARHRVARAAPRVPRPRQDRRPDDAHRLGRRNRRQSWLRTRGCLRGHPTLSATGRRGSRRVGPARRTTDPGSRRRSERRADFTLEVGDTELVIGHPEPQQSLVAALAAHQRHEALGTSSVAFATPDAGSSKTNSRVNAK